MIMPRPLITLAFIFVGGLIAIAVALWAAPARWADAIAERVTSGRVRLAESSGSLWTGSARLVLADPSTNNPPFVEGVVVPGRCDWVLSPFALILGRIDLQLKLTDMREAVKLAGDRQILRGTGGSFDLPAVRMDRLGSPWNTIAPDGALSLRWEPFVIEKGRYTGKAAVTIAQVSSAISPVKPLGSYRVDIDSTVEKTALSMVTLSGPLELEGQGDFSPKTGLRFLATGQAQTDQARLQPLLGLIGKRDGVKTIIRLGAS